MIRIRRSPPAARLELLPLIDVVFLLLTFFLYSMVVMVRADVLPVQLVGVGTGEAAEGAQVAALTIDRVGQVHLNRQPLEGEALEARLAELAEADPPARLVLAMEAADDTEAAVDRAPMFFELLERIREAGIEDFALVGEPASEAGGPEP